MSAIEIPWQAPWRALAADEASELQAQLEREIGFRHPLARTQLIVVGRRDDNDDVVARSSDGTFINVHLVWKRSALGLSKVYPSWFAYGNLDGFLGAMHRDAAEQG